MQRKGYSTRSGGQKCEVKAVQKFLWHSIQDLEDVVIYLKMQFLVFLVVETAWAMLGEMLGAGEQNSISSESVLQALGPTQLLCHFPGVTETFATT